MIPVSSEQNFVIGVLPRDRNVNIKITLYERRERPKSPLKTKNRSFDA